MKMLSKLSSVQAVVLITALFLASCSSPRGPVPLSDEVPETTGWTSETIVEGLNRPWGVTWLPDTSMLITEKEGVLNHISADGSEMVRLTGVPEVFSEGQGGLMDISLHPDFEENNLIYFTYSRGTDDANQTVLARAELGDSSIENVEVLFEVTPVKNGGQHFGSRVVWLADGTLLMSIGDGGNPPTEIDGTLIRKYAQRGDAYLGKVVRLNDDGSIPDDNPFVNNDDIYSEIWTMGHRNIQGIAYDSESGNVWANEHGARGGDELNLLEPGENYGWPEVTYSREYWGPEISDKTSMEGMANPKIVWTPSIAPSGLAYYTGDRYPEWKGNLFSGNLAGTQIRRIVLDGESIANEETLQIGTRVRDVRQGPDGFLYYLTDVEGGGLYRIVSE